VKWLVATGLLGVLAWVLVRVVAGLLILALPAIVVLLIVANAHPHPGP